eukprot:g3886.t1
MDAASIERMDHDGRIRHVKKLLDERRLSTVGHRRKLVARLLEAVAVDAHEDVDDDAWLWLHDTQDELVVLEESKHRKDMARIFNKRREDFGEGDEYDALAHNEYLEKVEEVVFNLTHKIDEAETQAFVQAYERENADLIFRNNARSNEERQAAQLAHARAEQVREQQRQQHARLESARRADLRTQIEESNEVLLGERDANAMSAPSAARVAAAAAAASAGADEATAAAAQQQLLRAPTREPVMPSVLPGASAAAQRARSLGQRERRVRQQRAAGAAAFNARDLDELCAGLSV